LAARVLRSGRCAAAARIAGRGPPARAQVVESDRKQMSEKQFVAVAKLDEVPAGAKRLVEVGGIEVLLCHTLDKVFAVRNLCSHAHEALDNGRMKNGWLACPVHGARFDLETGQPINPPATMPIEKYEVLIEGDTISIAI
jgi:3-phenylpropionate/trans-cinnamate dioxygenase ferredoxin subunit